MTNQEFEILKTKLNNAIRSYCGVSNYTSTILSAIEDNLEYLYKYEINNLITYNSNYTDRIEEVKLRVRFIVGGSKSYIEFSYKRDGKSQSSTITTYGSFSSNGIDNDHTFSSAKEISKTNLTKFIREGQFSKSSRLLKLQLQNILNKYNLSKDLLIKFNSLIETLEDKEIEGDLDTWRIEFEDECCYIQARFEHSPNIDIKIDMR